MPYAFPDVETFERVKADKAFVAKVYAEAEAKGIKVLGLLPNAYIIPGTRNKQLNLTHFCIILTANIKIASITPPVGLNLFVISSTTRVKLTEVACGAVPFVLAMIAGMIVITYVPAISLAFF